MEKLTEYIKQNYYKNIYKESLKDYFGENLPDYIIESTDKYEFKDFILDNLNTHDIHKLQDKIFELFGSQYELGIKYANDKKESFWLVSSPLDISKNEDFKNLVEFFGYYISNIDIEMEENELIEYIYICPKYSKSADKMVYKENDGILYHFTTTKFANEILKKGLRCKTPKYRNYPKNYSYKFVFGTYN